MTWEQILRSNGQVRPLWRFLVSTTLMVLATVVVAVQVKIVYHVLGRQPGFVELQTVFALLMLVALLAILKLLAVVFEKRPVGASGLAFCGRWKLELAHGVGVGALMIFSVGGLEILLGVGQFSWGAAPPDTLLGAGAASAVVLLVAATNEEIVFRGYPFQRLVDSIGPVGAIAVTSVLFGVIHLGNPSRTGLSTLNTMLVGVPFGVAYLRTRALWLPIGIHFGWNFFQGYGLGLPVSGLILPVTTLRAEVTGAEWLTGGAYGPEGGVLGSVAIVAGTVYLFAAKSIYTSEAMKALVFGPPPAERPPELARLGLDSGPSAPPHSDRLN